MSSLQVPKEKRLLSLPKVAEVTEEQEKRSVNLGPSMSYSRLHMQSQKGTEKMLNIFPSNAWNYIPVLSPRRAAHAAPVVKKLHIKLKHHFS